MDGLLPVQPCLPDPRLGGQTTRDPESQERPGKELHDLTTPVKKVKKIEGPTVVVEASSIAEALLYETKMHGKDVPMVQLRANHSVYLFNRTSQEWSSDRGFVCGFGRACSRW